MILRQIIVPWVQETSITAYKEEKYEKNPIATQPEDIYNECILIQETYSMEEKG